MRPPSAIPLFFFSRNLYLSFFHPLLFPWKQHCTYIFSYLTFLHKPAFSTLELYRLLPRNVQEMKIATGTWTTTRSCNVIWRGNLRLPARAFHKLEVLADSLNLMSKNLTELISGKCHSGDLNDPFCTRTFWCRLNLIFFEGLSLAALNFNTVRQIYRLFVQSDCYFWARTGVLIFFFPSKWLSEISRCFISTIYVKKMEVEWVEGCWEFSVSGVICSGMEWLLCINNSFFPPFCCLKAWATMFQ